MCHAKLVATDKARDYYDQVVRWMNENPDLPQERWAQELKMFQAEAEAVLAEKGPPAALAPRNS